MAFENGLEDFAYMVEKQRRYLSDNDPAWSDPKRNEYYRGIWIECGEMLDEYGWKWWNGDRPGSPLPDGLTLFDLEVADVWYFGMADVLKRGCFPDSKTVEHCYESIIEFSDLGPGMAESFDVVVELMARRTLDEKRFSITAFFAALNRIGYTMPRLRNAYDAKMILNEVRRRMRERYGAYHKIWDNKKDVTHLLEMATIPLNVGQLRKDLEFSYEKMIYLPLSAL